MATKKQTFTYNGQTYLVEDLEKAHQQQINYYKKFLTDKYGFDQGALDTFENNLDNVLKKIRTNDDTWSNFEEQAYPIKFYDGRYHYNEKNWLRQDVGKASLNKYFKGLATILKPYTPEEDPKKTWDDNKYGFGKFLESEGISEGDLWTQYDRKTKDNEDTLRSTTERFDLFKNQLSKYYNYLNNNNIDWNADDDVQNDSFLKDLKALITQTNWTPAQVAQTLSKYGADNYVKGFTHTTWSPDVTEDAQRDIIAQRQQKEALTQAQEKEKVAIAAKEKQWENYVDGLLATYRTYSNSQTNMANFNQRADITPTTEEESLVANRGHWANEWATLYQRNPFDQNLYDHRLYLLMKYLPNEFQNYTDIHGTKWYYYKPLISRDNNAFVKFDPVRGIVQREFSLALPHERERVKKQWEIDQGHRSAAEAYYKTGGVLKMQDGGDFVYTDEYLQGLMDQAEEHYRNKAQQYKKSPEYKNEQAQRVVTTADNQISGLLEPKEQPKFTTADRLILGSLAGNLLSMLGTPTFGAITGGISSALEFAAGIKQDGLDWGDVGNFGVNLGLDVLGLVPIFGDTIGTGSKIVKTLANYAPKAMAAVAGIQGLTNADQITESWKKTLSNDALTNLTVQDYQNILQSINLLVGGVRWTRNANKHNQIEYESKINDAAVVTVKDKYGKVKNILVDGDIATNVKAHRNNPTQVKEDLSVLDDLKQAFDSRDLEIVVEEGNLQFPIGKDSNGHYKRRSIRTSGNAVVRDAYDFAQQGIFKRLFESANDANYHDYRKAYTVEEGNQYRNLRKPLDEQIAVLRSDLANRQRAINLADSEFKKATRAAEKARTKYTSQQYQEKIDILQSTYFNKLTDLQNSIKTTRQQLDEATSAVHSIQNNISTTKNNKVRNNLNQNLIKAKKRMEQLSSNLQTQERDLQLLSKQYNAKVKTLNNLTSQKDKATDYEQLDRKAQAKSDLLSQAKSTPQSYDDLRRMVEELQQKHSKIGDKTVSWNFDELLKQAGIKERFRVGGKIDVNKINNYLKYAKG